MYGKRGHREQATPRVHVRRSCGFSRVDAELGSRDSRVPLSAGTRVACVSWGVSVARCEPGVAAKRRG
jgi:hypothetical protein